MKKRWKAIWCKSLGEKISDCNKEADIACIIRTVYVVIMFATCFFIIANTIHQW